MRMMCNSQKSFSWSREISFGSCFALEASIQSASPAHRVLADGVTQEEISVDAKVIAALGLVILGRINFSIDLFFNFYIRFLISPKLVCNRKKSKVPLVINKNVRDRK